MVDDDNNQILDPAIKLFGKSIQLPETSSVGAETARCCGMDSGLEEESDDESTLNGEEPEQQHESSNSQKADQINATSGTDGIIEKPIDQNKASTLCSSWTDEDNGDIALPEEKTLKKPDKIIPCPRCDSMDTKFCYFNNYNVNQPRYFCRKCQRYWTSGGTMRNLPVGAGRRKSKSSALHYSNPTIAAHGDFQSASVPRLNGTVHRPVALNGAVLSFAPDQHIHQTCSPDAVDLARIASTQNGSTNPLTEARVVINDNVTGSAGSVSNGGNEDEYKAKSRTAQNYQSFQPQMLCYPTPLWPPFPWNPAQYNYPLPGPINIRPGFPMPFYPAPMYMGCAAQGAWNVPWSPPSSPNMQPDPKSPTLGKHSRDNCVAKPSNVAEDEKSKEESHKPSLWVPKTLRIGDLEEAAKSSMWATLGIKTDNSVSAGGKGHCRPFSSLSNETSHPMTTSSSLLANPAALSRSMNFHEST